MKQEIKIYSDGGSRGNPGPGGIGYVIYKNDEILTKGKHFLGETTNNKAEYTALLMALEKAKQLQVTHVQCFLDSELVVKQLKREYKVKEPDLAVLFVKVWNLSQGFDKISYTHIRRAENMVADRLVNEAIDEALKK